MSSEITVKLPGNMALTVKERTDEKNVPSSYRESLERTPSKTAANCGGQ